QRYYNKHQGTAQGHMREYRRGVRLEVLTHYSKGEPQCVCCGEKILEFLCMDHINGGGSRQSKKTGVNIYAWLRKNEFPLGFRVLCHNCNSALGFYGYCPHSEVKSEIIVD
ncbi:hypothetical protein LCGC14_2017220, partial [marine sediment metagenome]